MGAGDNDRRVLVADDQPDVLESLRLLLKGEGFTIDTANSPGSILRAVEDRDFDAVLMDLNYTRDTTSGREGLDLLPRLRSLDDMLPIIVMTAWGSIEGAVEAMQRGARDYIEKPWENTRLIATLNTQVELGRALRTSRRLADANRLLRGEGYPTFIAECAAMQPVRRMMERVAPSAANVLITGEHGTGKEVVARWLHAASRRSGKSFVTVNIGGLAEQVFESELFGHVKGAFTDAKSDRVGRFELADGGTLFLDEIANLPTGLQGKLLRVLQSGEFERVGSSRSQRADVRVLSATNADLATEVSEDRFREDLLFRLNTVEIRVPPLRERREDIPLLAAHFLSRHVERYRKPLHGFDPGAMQALLEHAWPGNVRELDHVVERAVLMADGDAVRASDLGMDRGRIGVPSFDEMTLDDAERELIRRALSRCSGNVTEAAKLLGVSRSALYRRMQRHGL
ncbi:MAG: sigma-54 dependent transcriptional regulator [Gemmatimonadales bacterium]|jgi:DNA-binding NtrC family response regulator